MASAPQPSPYHLVRGGLEDMDAVEQIMGAAFAPCFGEGWSRSQCAGILPMRGVTLMLLADDSGSPAAFALWRTLLDESELLLIAVEPDHQQEGLGRQLVEHFRLCAAEEGARRLHLEVRDGNSAVSLYQRAGFQLAGRRRDYYTGRDGSKHDALTYSLQVER